LKDTRGVNIQQKFSAATISTTQLTWLIPCIPLVFHINVQVVAANWVVTTYAEVTQQSTPTPNYDAMGYS